MRVEEGIACLMKRWWKLEKKGLREIRREEKGKVWGISGFLSEGVLSRFQLWLFAQGSPGIYQSED